MKGQKKDYVIPKAGSSFKRNWKGEIYELTVVYIDNTIKYKVDNELFSTPSSAAKSITKQEVNGWRFWKIDKLSK